MKNINKALFAFVLSMTFAGLSFGQNVFYVDPVLGSASGDGSSANPWKTLQAVFDGGLIESRGPASFPYSAGGALVTKNAGAPIKAGDTIRLRSGFHGDILGRGYFNSDYVTIEADTGHTPRLKRFHLQGGENWKLKGLSISPEFAGTFSTSSIVDLESHNWHGPVSNVTVEDSTLFSTSDSSSWSAADWNARAADGIEVDGSNIVIRNNRIKNVHFGVNTSGDDILAESNIIENYSGDGMRGGGDRVTFQYNTINWSYEVDGNHDDAIQFFRAGGVAHRDVVLRGNKILGYADPERPLTHGPQGIGNFNGPYINWIVENNVVLVAHYHGISIFGAENAIVTNNTVLDISREFDPWIKLSDSTGGVVRNNLATDFQIAGIDGLTSDHNLTLDATNLDALLRDWQNADVRLNPETAAIDAGSADLAPVNDVVRRPRQIGAAVDLGAYEYTLDADFDSDADVDGSDFLDWQRGRGILDQAKPADGDADDDGAVNFEDLEIWESVYGLPQSESLSASTSTSVPEPPSTSIVAIAMLLSFQLPRRGKQRI